MLNNSEKIVLDSNGKPVEILLPYDYYLKLISELEEADEIKAFDAAKSLDDELIPISQAET